MRSDKNNQAYILHFRDAIDHISTYTASHTFHEFDQSEWDQAAVLRYLEIVGEAANKIDPDFRKVHPEIPWREVVDLRNVIIHDYMNVDIALIWKIMTVDISKLRDSIQTLLDK